MSSTFLEQCISGRVLLDEIDDFVERWHEGEASSLSLPEFLGLSPEEYAIWVEQPDALAYIVYAHKTSISLEDALEQQTTDYHLAARAPNAPEREKIIEWLKATGRL